MESSIFNFGEFSNRLFSFNQEIKLDFPKNMNAELS